MIVLADFAIETNQALFILTIVGCVYSLVLNTYIFFAIKNNVFIRYPYVCMLVTSGAVVFSVAMVVMAFLSRPMFDTGGAEGHGRVKHLTIQLLVANVAQFVSVNIYYFSVHRETQSDEKYNIDLDLSQERWRGSLPSMILSNHQ